MEMPDFEKIDNFVCPMCEQTLTHHPPVMHNFSWTNPRATCSCGFSFEIKNNNQTLPNTMKIESGFDLDYLQANQAYYILVEKLTK